VTREIPVPIGDHAVVSPSRTRVSPAWQCPPRPGPDRDFRRDNAL